MTSVWIWKQWGGGKGRLQFECGASAEIGWTETKRQRDGEG